MNPRTLIADDQPHVLEALRLLLKSEGYQTEAVTSPRAVLDRLASNQYDLVLMDLNYALDTTSGQEGLDLLSRVQRLDSTLPVVVMTAWGSIPLAVEAMRRGARDFVEKPWDNGALLTILRQQIEARRKQPAAGPSRGQGEELVEAAATQRGLLPHELPHAPGCQVAVTWQPLGSVGGDYLDVLDAGDGRLALGVGDVIGKGVPAALLMSNLQAAVRVLASEQRSPREIAGRANRLAARNVGTGKFISFFYGVLEAAHGRLFFTNAGHNAPMLLRGSGEMLRLEEGGAVLGIFPEWSYTQAEVPVEAGDRLVLFTDGVTEAENASGECFGEARLVECLRANADRDAEGLREALLAAVTQFCGGRFSDDATLVVVTIEADSPALSSRLSR
ncbi:MAG TPA: fused response regulator/phosphatase [Bryobacteraceae bacterium]|nr:fused response regulator/phosphatase [Bryobacteraceae bacterium]